MATPTPDDREHVRISPLDVDGVGAVMVGTALFAIALVVTWVLRPQLKEAGNDWWVWVCLSGTVLGLIGLPYVMRRRAAYRLATSTDVTSESTSASTPDSTSASTSTSTSDST